ncbi:MAG: extracellular solute-binding protein [Lachnospiraceae bacterium]|nr:extracellular solute-binding protein [Lachnospiraceae bacterium]
MKMKTVKRFMATVLATAMTMSVAACGNNAPADAPASSDPVESKEESSEVVESSEEDLGAYTVIKDENGNPIDLGGIEVIVRDWWSPAEAEEPKNAYEEARQEYRDWIQETYNFTIKNVGISSWASTPEDFANYATTGGDEHYVFVLRQGSELVSAMNSKLMYDLSTLDCLDFSEDKWKDGVHNMFSKGTAIYGMRGETPEPRGGLYFNKRLLTEAGIDPQSIYELQENMEWTWAKFEEICEAINADTDNDGVIDRYALACVNQDFFEEAVYSNGGEYIGKDENGKYYNRLDSQETLDALNWSLDVIGKYAKVFASDASWDYAYTAFYNGEVAFIPQQAYKAGEWKDMEDDFGFVCFPMGPNASDYTNCYTDNVMAIPACYDAEKAWKIAFAYNLWTEPVPGYEDEPVWKQNYYSNFKDTEAVDLTLQRMTENGMVTYHTFINGLSMGSDLYWKISKENTPAQQAETIRPTWASYIDTANQ